MKIFILLSFSIFLLSRCNIHVPGARIDYSLTIKNETSKNVKIITYQYGYSSYISHFKTIYIAPVSDYTEFFYFYEEDWSKLYDEGLFNETDSIIIIYGKEKFKSFTCGDSFSDQKCKEARNPLEFKYRTTIEYTITEEDYQNAEDCDGRCE